MITKYKPLDFDLLNKQDKEVSKSIIFSKLIEGIEYAYSKGLSKIPIYSSKFNNYIILKSSFGKSLDSALEYFSSPDNEEYEICCDIRDLKNKVNKING